MLCMFKCKIFKLCGKTVDMFEDNRESDCGPGFGWMSPESFRIKITQSGCYLLTILYMFW